MKRIFSLLLSVLLLGALLFSAVSCAKENGKPESALEKQFNAMYDAFNKKDYDTYLSYFRLDEEIMTAMKNNFEAAKDLFDQKYELDSLNLLTVDDEHNFYLVEVATLNTSLKKSDNITRVLKEHLSYGMQLEDGIYYITVVDVGETEIIDVPVQETETLSDEEYAKIIIDAFNKAQAEAASPES